MSNKFVENVILLKFVTCNAKLCGEQRQFLFQTFAILKVNFVQHSFVRHVSAAGEQGLISSFILSSSLSQ